MSFFPTPQFITSEHACCIWAVWVWWLLQVVPFFTRLPKFHTYPWGFAVASTWELEICSGCSQGFVCFLTLFFWRPEWAPTAVSSKTYPVKCRVWAAVTLESKSCLSFTWRIWESVSSYKKRKTFIKTQVSTTNPAAVNSIITCELVSWVVMASKWNCLYG